jgi:predicted transposase YdaD
MQTNDILWKSVIEDFFEDFMFFFFSKDANLIDFSRGYEFLDQELAQLFPESVSTKRYVDKLVKVYLKDGEERWILIHIEVQGYQDKNFPERMFCYFYRLKDRFGIEITALAIFTDKNPKYKPKKYYKNLLGTKISYEFNIYKVLSQKESELEKSINPFALIVLATLNALKKGKLDDIGIAEVKRNLTKLLYERKYPEEKIQKIFYFINYYIRFAKHENTLIFAEEILSTYQPELKNMGIQEQVILIEKEESYKDGINYGKEIGIDLGKEIGIDLGIDLGIENKTIEVILTAHSKGLTLDFIAEIVNLPLNKVKQIIEEHLNK